MMKRKTLEEPGAFDTLTASLTDVLLAQHGPARPRLVPSPACTSLTSTPPDDLTWLAREDRYMSRPSDEAKSAGALPSASQSYGSHDSQHQTSSAPIFIRGRNASDSYGRQRDSFALTSPQSVPMVRSTSNGLSSQPTSYAPSQFMSCEFSECGSFKPTFDGLLGSPLSRRISIDQATRPRLHQLRDLVNQSSRAPSTERKALLDAWRCADMDPPNGAREDGTEHFAFFTDEELQAAQVSETHSSPPASTRCDTPAWLA